MQTTLRMVSASAQGLRDPANWQTDAAALRAIAQAAVEVELFTVPLYMTALYSIQGMHPITSSGNSFYEGRLWPGPATTAFPSTANEKAFNIVFSVFIQEMLHLQLASNMATTINLNGAAPLYTSPALMDPTTHAWTCYGPDLTVIPHIIDLRDTIRQTGVKVNIGGLTREQLQLFLVIEQPDNIARADIQPDKVGKYFPIVPFAGWSSRPGAADVRHHRLDVPVLLRLLHLKYSDGTTLWSHVFAPGGQQNDEFNSFAGADHPMREFMGFEASVAQTYPDIAFAQMGLMMDAITDQGEGSTLVQRLRAARAASLAAVKPQYQADSAALKSDYPSYSDGGQLEASADAVARSNDIRDHYECFQEILGTYVDEVVTWPAWLAEHGPWTAADLTTSTYTPNSQLPDPARHRRRAEPDGEPATRCAGLLQAAQPGLDRLDRRGHHGARPVLERAGAVGFAGAVPVPVDVGLGRPHGDLLGGVRQGAGPVDRARPADRTTCFTTRARASITTPRRAISARIAAPR